MAMRRRLAAGSTAVVAATGLVAGLATAPVAAAAPAFPAGAGRAAAVAPASAAGAGRGAAPAGAGRGATSAGAGRGATSAGTPHAVCQGRAAPWMNTRLSAGERAALLVSHMTLAQETQMTAAVSNATESRE